MQIIFYNSTMTRKNRIETVKIQFTADKTTESILENMVSLGIHGANKAEVVSWIVSNWIWSNHEQLQSNGIKLLQSGTQPIGP